jgi:legume-like lectin family protein
MRSVNHHRYDCNSPAPRPIDCETPPRLESLEQRRLLTAQINFDSGFATTTGLSLNGGATTSGTALQLTDNNQYEARTAFWTTPVPIEKFTTHFSFNISPGAMTADGLTFTVQNESPTTVGADGGNLGYTNITSSAALMINFFNFGAYGSTLALATGGALPSSTNDISSEIDLHSGDTMDATATYDGTNLAVTLTDATDASKTITESYPVDLTQTVGGNTAYVGFTAATGNSFSTQKILSWDYTGSNTPTITAVASATPNPVTGTTTALSVAATDNGADLTYSWALASKPNGAEHDPIFSENGTDSSDSITAKFFKAGRYGFRVTIANAYGQSITSYISVLVNQTPSRMALDPHMQILHNGDTQQYLGVVRDQFGNPLRTQPTIVYSLDEGGGSISSTGLFTSDGVGHVVVRATGDSLVGTVGATVLKPL